MPPPPRLSQQHPWPTHSLTFWLMTTNPLLFPSHNLCFNSITFFTFSSVKALSAITPLQDSAQHYPWTTHPLTFWLMTTNPLLFPSQTLHFNSITFFTFSSVKALSAITTLQDSAQHYPWPTHSLTFWLMTTNPLLFPSQTLRFNSITFFTFSSVKALSAMTSFSLSAADL